MADFHPTPDTGELRLYDQYSIGVNNVLKTPNTGALDRDAPQNHGRGRSFEAEPAAPRRRRPAPSLQCKKMLEPQAHNIACRRLRCSLSGDQ
jgi:hypothetical protein